jgi:hypothetical protein
MKHAKASANDEPALHISGSQPSASGRGSCHSDHWCINTPHASCRFPREATTPGNDATRIHADGLCRLGGCFTGQPRHQKLSARTTCGRCAQNAEATRVWRQRRGCGAREHPDATEERRTTTHLKVSASARPGISPRPRQARPKHGIPALRKGRGITVWRLRAEAGRGSRTQILTAGPLCGSPPSHSARRPASPCPTASPRLLKPPSKMDPKINPKIKSEIPSIHPLTDSEEDRKRQYPEGDRKVTF